LRGFEGGLRPPPPNIHCAPTSGGTLSKAAYAVLTELGDWDGVKVIADTNYAGLPSKKQRNFAW